MARPSSNRTSRDSQPPVPVYKIKNADVENAWQAFHALQIAGRDNPTLLTNPYFTALQDTGYARFLAVFEAL